MAKRKITADDLAAILSDSDSSESNFDDSVEDMDWDPLPLSDEKNYEDDEKVQQKMKVTMYMKREMRQKMQKLSLQWMIV